MAEPKTTWEFDADLKKISAKLDELEAQLRETGETGAGAGQSVGKGFGDLVPMLGKITAALASARGAWEFLQRTISTAGEFETLQARLENMYGSVEAGKDAFNAFNKVAATTPFSLKGVVEAGATLKAFGVDAQGSIKDVADLAAFMGVDVVEAAGAMGRAFSGGVGAADILRERGILNLVKSFKGIDDLTKLTLPEFRKALIETIQDPAAGIAGATDKMSKTFQGAMSNMFDSLDRVSAFIGSTMTPAFGSMARGVSGLADKLLPKLSEQLANEQVEMNALFNILTDNNSLQDTRSRAIQDITDKYGSYLKGLNLEKANLDEIDKLQKSINREFEKRIKIQAAEEILAEKFKKLADAQKNLFDATVKRDIMQAKAAQGDYIAGSKALGYAVIIDKLKVEIKDLTDDYNKYYQTIMADTEISEGLKKKTQEVQLVFEKTATVVKNATEAMKKYQEASEKIIQDAIDETEEKRKLREETEALQKVATDYYNELNNQDTKAQIDTEKKLTEEIKSRYENLQNLLENNVQSMVKAGIAGKDMGEALKSALEEIAAKLITLAALWAIFQFIPGGQGFAGGILPFIGKGFGFGGGSGLQSGSGNINIDIIGSLPGQRFYLDSVKRQEISAKSRIF